MRRPSHVAAASLTIGLAALTGFVWADRGEPVGTPPLDRTELDGASLFRAKGCVTCHDGPDADSPTGVAPSLVAVATWAGGRKPGLSAEAYVRESIRDPAAFISPGFSRSGPAIVMPSMAISDAELEALLAYLLGR